MKSQTCARQIRNVMVIAFMILQFFSSVLIFAQDHTLKVKVTGTGQTTGHIANLSVTNSTGSPVKINPQTCFIPSDGQYQPYVATIPGKTIPPGTTSIPVEGYCADVHTPPVPSGNPMPPIEEWIPVENPNVSVPEGSVNIVPKEPVSPFDAKDIPSITSSPGYKPHKPNHDADIVVTWPGTDVMVGGTVKPGKDPETFAPLFVEVLTQIAETFDQLKEEGTIHTPFSGDPEKEREAVIQQTFWIYTSALSDDQYEKPAFSDKVYEQYEDNSGTEVTTLAEDQKDKLDGGIDEFWNTFSAVGVEAKVLSETSPGLGLNPETLATVSSPKCECENISYNLEVKRGDVVVHSQSHTTPDNPKVSIAGFAFGDVLDVKITNIRANCNCDEQECLFYPAQSTNKNSSDYTDPDMTRPGKVDIEMENDPAGEVSHNNNCEQKNKSFNEDRTEYSFTLETKNEGTKESAVFQKLRIKAYCKLTDCRKGLCAKYVQISFVTAN